MSEILPQPFEVTHGSVLRLAVPMMFAYVSTPLVGLVATGIIGQLGVPALIGGVALASVIFDVIFISCNFLRGATTGFTAQAIGAGNRVEEQSMLLGALGLALALSLAMLALAGPIAGLGFWVLGADPQVTAIGRDYYAVRIWSAPFVLFNFVAFGWVLGRGEAGFGLLLQTLLNALHVGLGFLFVLHLGRGVEGAALASVVAEAVTAAFGLFLILTRSSRSAWRLSEMANPVRLRRMLQVNSDMMIRSLALLLGLSFFTRESATFGVDILAANTILMRFYFFAISFLDGIAMAAEQLSGRAVGARFRPAFDRTVRFTTFWGVLLAVLLSAAIFLSGPLVIELMTPVESIRLVSLLYLPWSALIPLTGVIAFQMDGIYIGATWSRDMRNMMLLSLVIYIASWALLAPLFGNHGLWAALLIFHGARSIAFRLKLRRLVLRTFPA